MTRSGRIAAAVACVFILACRPAVACAGWRDVFRDSTDGKFDASDYLLTRKGALVVPMIITEPAIGYGGGAAFVFFQQSIAEIVAQSQGRRRYRPPNIYAAAGFGTENGTWGGAGGGMMSLADDRWRLRGGGGYFNLNLDFYGSGGEGPKLGYTLLGVGGASELVYRLGSTNAWVGPRAQLFQLENRFDNAALAPFVDETRVSIGFGPLLEYDSRDNIFTPNRGWTSSVQDLFYEPAFGSDESFQSYRGYVFAYAPLPRHLVLGARLDARSTSGDAPFYMQPYIDLRGIPTVRYQGDHTAVWEGELRWNVTPRWALMGFGGAGRAWESHAAFSEAASHPAGGTGFRYLLARQLGFYSGLDFAWGPQFALYIQMGNAWR